MRVDFPDPDGPITAVRLPRAISSEDAAESVDGRLAFAEATAETPGGDQGPGSPLG